MVERKGGINMLEMPEFLKHTEWYEINKEYGNSIGNNDKKFIIKENAPEFIKKSYEEYIKCCSVEEDKINY